MPDESGSLASCDTFSAALTDGASTVRFVELLRTKKVSGAAVARKAFSPLAAGVYGGGGFEEFGDRVGGVWFTLPEGFAGGLQRRGFGSDN